jgi:hypothetical protein
LDDRYVDVLSPAFDDILDKDKRKIGNLYWGVFSDMMDCALVKLESKSKVMNEVHDIGKHYGDYLMDDENDQGMEVQLFGRTSQLQKGEIESTSCKQKIKYTGKNGKFKKELFDLIQTSKISAKGDSGAAVLTKNKKIIGILVASDNKYSYIIKIKYILNYFKLKIVKS